MNGKSWRFRLKYLFVVWRWLKAQRYGYNSPVRKDASNSMVELWWDGRGGIWLAANGSHSVNFRSFCSKIFLVLIRKSWIIFPKGAIDTNVLSYLPSTNPVMWIFNYNFQNLPAIKILFEVAENLISVWKLLCENINKYFSKSGA